MPKTNFKKIEKKFVKIDIFNPSIVHLKDGDKIKKMFHNIQVTPTIQGYSLATNATQEYIGYLDAKYTILAQWAWKKKWNKNHNIQAPQFWVEAFESLGEYFYRVLELCIQLHPACSHQYESGYEWFDKIINELKKDDLRAYLERREKKPFLVNKYSKGKVVEIQSPSHYYKEEAYYLTSQIRRLENPYEPDVEPHIYQLMNIAFSLVENPKTPNFKDEYWNPFLKSLAGINKHHRTNGRKFGHELDGRLKIIP